MQQNPNVCVFLVHRVIFSLEGKKKKGKKSSSKVAARRGVESKPGLWFLDQWRSVVLHCSWLVVLTTAEMQGVLQVAVL